MSSWYGGEPWAFINVSDRHLPQLRATVSQVYPVKRGKQACEVPFLAALTPTVPLREQQPHPPAQSPVANRGPVALHPENPSGAGRRAWRAAAGSTHGRLSHAGADTVCAHQRRRRRTVRSAGRTQTRAWTVLRLRLPLPSSTLSRLFSRPLPLCQAHCLPVLPSPSGLLGRGSSDLLPHPLSHLQPATCIRFPKLRLTTPPP